MVNRRLRYPAQCVPPYLPSARGAKEGLMVHHHSKPILVIDVKLHLRGRIYQLRLSEVLKWLVPLAVAIVQIISALRQDGP